MISDNALNLSIYQVLFNAVTMQDNAIMRDRANLCDNAIMRDNAKLFCDASAVKHAVLSQDQHVGLNNTVVETDLSKDLCESIRCQTSLIPFDDKVIAYTQVDKNMYDFRHQGLKYKVNEVVDVELNNEVDYLSFSNANHFNQIFLPSESIFLVAEIMLNDIIDVQQGSIRCHRAKIIGSYELKND